MFDSTAMSPHMIKMLSPSAGKGGATVTIIVDELTESSSGVASSVMRRPSFNLSRVYSPSLDQLMPRICMACEARGGNHLRQSCTTGVFVLYMRTSARRL